MGADEAGGKSVLFNTITVSDGISMGTPGMRYSLVSREVIADSIETVVGAQGFDGFVAIGGCDKNMPACAMAMARMDRPSVFVYGGTIQPGKNAATSISVFEAVGGHAAGTVSDIELKEVEAPPFRARAPAAACTPPTPWPRRSKRWVCRCQQLRPGSRLRRQAPGQLQRRCARVQPDRPGIKPSDILSWKRSKTPSPWPSRWKAPPTRCCTCWPSPRRRHPADHRRLHPRRRAGPGAGDMRPPGSTR